MKRNHSDGKRQKKPGLDKLISFSELHWSYLQGHYMHLCFRLLESPTHRERSKIRSSFDVKHTEFLFTCFFINSWTLAVLTCRITKAVTVPITNKRSEATPSIGKWSHWGAVRPPGNSAKIFIWNQGRTATFQGGWWAMKFALWLY